MHLLYSQVTDAFETYSIILTIQCLHRHIHLSLFLAIYNVQWCEPVFALIPHGQMLDHDGKLARFVAFQLDLLCISPIIMRYVHVYALYVCSYMHVAMYVCIVCICMHIAIYWQTFVLSFFIYSRLPPCNTNFLALRQMHLFSFFVQPSLYQFSCI